MKTEKGENKMEFRIECDRSSSEWRFALLFYGNLLGARYGRVRSERHRAIWGRGLDVGVVDVKGIRSRKEFEEAGCRLLENAIMI
ncbi:MAG: hypothetical protein IKP61_00255 [Spirochaetales bacterium]|nr:hypothetical protein [Spirochaetales bacterium]